MCYKPRHDGDNLLLSIANLGGSFASTTNFVGRISDFDTPCWFIYEASRGVETTVCSRSKIRVWLISQLKD